MIVAYPKFLNLNIGIVNPGNQIISQGENFIVQSVNPYSAGLVWDYSDKSNLSLVQYNVNTITLKCINLFPTESLTINAISRPLSLNTAFNITCVNSPANFALCNMSPSNMLVQWTGGITDTGYNIFYTDSLSNVSPIYTITSNSYYKTALLSNLATSTYYTVTIERFNTSGSIVNSISSISFAYALAPPSLNITSLTSNAILTWSSAASFGAIGYSLVSSNITNGTTTTNKLSLLNTYSVAVILTNSYIFTLSSCNVYKLYGASITTSVTSNDYALTPTNLKFNQMTPNSIAATWTANSNNGSYVISLTNEYGYKFTSNIYLAPSIENPLIFSSNLSFSSSNYSLNIIPYTPTRNIQGFTVTQPTGLYAYATSNINIALINGFTNTVTLTWATALNANSYVIDSIPSINRNSTLANSTTMSNLIYGSNYIFTVSSLNQYDVLGNSNTTIIPVRIGSGPSNLVITQFTQSLMRLSWSTNIDAAYYILNYNDLNGDLISTKLDYTISTIALSNIDTTNCNVNPYLTGYSISNYQYGMTGGHTQLITGLYAYPVTNIITTGLTENTIQLHWDIGLNNSFYSITILPLPTNGHGPYQTGTTDPNITINDLSANTQYTITIISQTPVIMIDNNIKTYISCSSNITVVTTLATPPPPPDAVTDFTATTINGTSVILTWTDGERANFYTITTSPNVIDTNYITQSFYPSGQGTTSGTFIELSLLTTYNITITSYYNSISGGSTTLNNITTTNNTNPSITYLQWSSNVANYGSSYLITNHGFTVNTLQGIIGWYLTPHSTIRTALTTYDILPNKKQVFSISFDRIINAGFEYNAIGLVNLNFNAHNYLGGVNSCGIYEDGAIGIYNQQTQTFIHRGFSINSGDIIDIAVDTSNNLVWIRNQTTDNTWYGDPQFNSWDPTAGQNGIDISYLGSYLKLGIMSWHNRLMSPPDGQVTLMQTMDQMYIPSRYEFIPASSGIPPPPPLPPAAQVN